MIKKIVNWLNSLVNINLLWIWFFICAYKSYIEYRNAMSVMHEMYAELNEIQACIIICTIFIAKILNANKKEKK